MRITRKLVLQIKMCLCFILVVALMQYKVSAVNLKQVEKLKVLENRISVLEDKLNKKGQIPLEDKLLTSIAVIESNNNPKAYNESSGAIGKFQLTNVIYDGMCHMTKEEAFDEHKNTACAKLYLTHLLNKYKGNISKTLQHYNAGYLPTNNNYTNKVLLVMNKNN